MGNEDALETSAAKMQFVGSCIVSPAFLGLRVRLVTLVHGPPHRQAEIKHTSQREREREREGAREWETTGTNRGVLQEEGRVEEAPDADEPAPPRHSRPRHSPRRLRHLPRRRSRSCAQLWVYLQSNNLGHVRTTFRFMFLLPNDLPSR
ncbi:uncharacterized protein LOC130774468 [Actinidia eriantha]|uniref:uncharacterized protein LOC130774468 n=1 Tax=Actinidia eriantha TaxID=165200 RepID=UPI0025878CAE|nr:uncharacterized protein LOC130774468 [Actinidia eriantha]